MSTRPVLPTIALVAAGVLLPVGIAVVDRAQGAPSTTSTASAPVAGDADPAAAGGSAGTDSTGTGSGSADAGGPGVPDSGSGIDGSGDGFGGQGWGGDGSGSDGSGSGASGGTGDGTTQTPGRRGRGWERAASTTQISGTPLASYKGVVLVDTELPSGEGAGTGITLTADGTILTNYHVVEGSTAITVTDSTTKKSYPATVVGFDRGHDLAVLRLTGASGLSTAVVNGSAGLGDAVTAVGQGGGQGTLYAASGTITATDEQITAGDEAGGSAETLTGLLETDADVVPGYSGGPLVDASGAVVGISTAASSGAEINGYAIPVDEAMSVATKIRSGQRTSDVHIGARGALGLTVAGSAAVRGAGVVEVAAGGAAAGAGITAGSVITAVDGTSVESASALTDALAGSYPGTRVKVTWTDADGTDHATTVTLGTAVAN